MTDGPYRPKISVSSPAVSFRPPGCRCGFRPGCAADGEAYGPRRRARVAFAAFLQLPDLGGLVTGRVQASYQRSTRASGALHRIGLTSYILFWNRILAPFRLRASDWLLWSLPP